MTMFGLSDHEVGTYTQASMVQSLYEPLYSPSFIFYLLSVFDSWGAGGYMAKP